MESSLTNADIRAGESLTETLSGFSVGDGSSRNLEVPGSPKRSPVPSVPNSPAIQSVTPINHAGTPANLSPNASTPLTAQCLLEDGPPVPLWTAPGATTSGVFLGLDQLERQQEESERRRREQESIAIISTPQTTTALQRHEVQGMVEYADDDESTLPSSTQDSSGNPSDCRQSHGDDTSHQSGESPNKLERIIRYTRRRLSASDPFQRTRRDADDPAEEDEHDYAPMLIDGHLQKLGRNGKWQTRWFETDGECLSYYKTSKRANLLATLDLKKVGSIAVREEDPKGCSFTIQVLGRPYHLQAESKAKCKDWVITLNRVKEARLEQGNVKLVNQTPPDLLDRRVSVYSSRVITESNRPRTRAVDEDIESWGRLIKESDEVEDVNLQHDPAYEIVSSPVQQSMPQVVLARWQKRRSAMSRLAAKLVRWARSLKKYKCTDVSMDAVVLDPHLHPPGHNDGLKKVETSEAKSVPVHVSYVAPDENMPVLEQTTVTDGVSQQHAPAPLASNEEDEQETRYLS